MTGPKRCGETSSGWARQDLLDILVSDFKRGKSPEAIHDAYETVSLADVYSVLAYYLRHRGEVEAYLAQQDREAKNTQARIEKAFPPDGRRAELLSRLHE